MSDALFRISVIFTFSFPDWLFIYRQQSRLARHTTTSPPRLLFFPPARTRSRISLISSSIKTNLLHIRPFVTTSIQTKSQPAYAMDDFEDSFEITMMDDNSDGFSPEKPVKKAPAKKTATAKPTISKKATTTAPKKSAAAKSDKPKSDKPKAPAKPRAKKPTVTQDVDDGMSFEMDRTFDVLETPQLSSEGHSPPRPTVLQEQKGSTKNASETYQKVMSSSLSANSSLRNSNTFLCVLIPYDLF